MGGLFLAYATWIEWESLQDEFEIYTGPNFEASEILPDGTEKIRIYRDENYNIKGIIDGEYETVDELKILEEDEPSQSGTFFVPKDLEIKNYSDIYTITMIIGSSSATLRGFEYTFSANSVCHKHENDKKTAWLTEYYLNGPKNPLFSSSIAYDAVTTYKKSFNIPDTYFDLPNTILNNLHEDNTEFMGGRNAYMPSFNYSLINYENEEGEDQYFIIYQVPDKLGPKWTKNIGIEYRDEWGIPDLVERIKISEIISFVFGRQLLKVGHTKFDKKGDYIEEFVVNPRLPSSINIKSVCALSDRLPIEIRPYEPKIPIEPILNHIITSYLKLRDELHLDSVFWRYWLSNALNFDSNIALLASSIETLSNSWYKSNNSKSRGKYLEKVDFETLLEDEFELIDTKLDGERYKDRIMNRILNTYQMGGNERLNNFFKEIGLVIGPIEKKAIKDRNKPVHGAIMAPEESESLYKSNEAYRTLFNRTILKILD